MSNMIYFNYKSNKDDLKGDLNMSNGGTSMFIIFSVSAAADLPKRRARSGLWFSSLRRIRT